MDKIKEIDYLVRTHVFDRDPLKAAKSIHAQHIAPLEAELAALKAENERFKEKANKPKLTFKQRLAQEIEKGNVKETDIEGSFGYDF